MPPMRNRTVEPILETGEPDFLETDATNQSRLTVACLWMTLMSLALFFFPVVNGLVAGAVGGYKMGNAKNAVMAAVLPSMAAACGLWMLYMLIDLPVIKYFQDMVIALLIALSVAGMFVEASIGGTIAQNHIDRLNRA